MTDLQSQLYSHGTKIDEIIGTVNDSLTTPDNLSANKIPVAVPGEFGNAVALAAAQATIVSLQA